MDAPGQESVIGKNGAQCCGDGMYWKINQTLFA